jgi:hypothetical protein
MGELIGIPEWLALTLYACVALAVWMAWSFRSIRMAHRRLAEKRPSPDREQFLAMMRDDVDEDVAAWMWDELQVYYRPLTPHPDDQLIDDVKIDDDDIGLDWLPAFAKAQGLDHRSWPDWPEGWALTVRNFARFLQLGRDQRAWSEVSHARFTTVFPRAPALRETRSPG